MVGRRRRRMRPRHRLSWTTSDGRGYAHSSAIPSLHLLRFADESRHCLVSRSWDCVSCAQICRRFVLEARRSGAGCWKAQSQHWQRTEPSVF